jgi:hypothetical protein
MTDSTGAQIVAHVQDLVRTRYVRESKAERIADGLQPLREVRDADAARLAAALTARLQEASHDGHLRVRHCPGGVRADEDHQAYEEHYSTEAARNAGGLRRVQRVDERTGVLEIAPYLSPAHMAAPYVEAAFRLLTGIGHLVIDLRAGRGGLPETVALLCGYLLGDRPVHLQDMVGRDRPPRQFWTMPSPYRLPDDVRVDVLTSRDTFSGCEELAYDLQAFNRATVIGEITGGGAHPRETFRLSDVLEAHIPVASPVNAVTGSNWEGTGVQPDLPCQAGEALGRALSER